MEIVNEVTIVDNINPNIERKTADLNNKDEKI